MNFKMDLTESLRLSRSISMRTVQNEYENQIKTKQNKEKKKNEKSTTSSDLCRASVCLRDTDGGRKPRDTRFLRGLCGETQG
jgi:hypothetical protein